MSKLGIILPVLYRNKAARSGYILREFWSARTWISTIPQSKARCVDCYSQRHGTSFLVYTGSYPTTAPNYVEEYGYLTSARPGDSLFWTF